MYWTFKPTKEELEEYKREQERREAFEQYAISYLQAKVSRQMEDLAKELDVDKS